MDKRSNADNRNLCCFSYSDGRRCRMLRHRDHPGLCPFHSREERQQLESERIGTELAASLTGHYLTASDINHILGKVFTALAQDRISVKKAKALAYLAQLMLQSLSGVGQEYKFKYSFEAWQRMVKNSVRLPDPPAPIDPWESVDDSETPNVGAGFSPSPTATRERHSPNGDDATTPLGVGPLGPTLEPQQNDLHLSSPHPSANFADACGDSFALNLNDDATTDNSDEENTDEPVLVSAGSFRRRRKLYRR